MNIQETKCSYNNLSLLLASDNDLHYRDVLSCHISRLYQTENFSYYVNFYGKFQQPLIHKFIANCD